MTAMALPIAAIVHEHGDAADAMVRDFVAGRAAAGLDVRGLVMVRRPAAPAGAVQGAGTRARRCLQDVHSGEFFEIFQDLGAGAHACSLDTSRLLAAGSVLRAAIAAHPDLVVVSRFGRQESEGGGFAAEFLGLMSEGIPLLTVVAHDLLEAWRRFTGGLGVELPMEPARWRQWVSQNCDGGVPMMPAVG